MGVCERRELRLDLDEPCGQLRATHLDARLEIGRARSREWNPELEPWLCLARVRVDRVARRYDSDSGEFGFGDHGLL